MNYDIIFQAEEQEENGRHACVTAGKKELKERVIKMAMTRQEGGLGRNK